MPIHDLLADRRLPGAGSRASAFRAKGWRALVGLVVLILMASLPLSASAEGGMETYVFYLAGGANKSLTDLCVGDVVTIDIKAERFLRNRRGMAADEHTNPPVQVFGVTITGTVGNPEVGSLFFTRQITSARGTPPGSAQFHFTATKAGSTGIVFRGTKIATGWFDHFVSGNKDYLSTELEATVRDCEYSVSATSRWHGFNVDYTAIVSDVRMTSTGGGKYTGEGTWTFITTDNPASCAPHTQIYEAPVVLNGELDGDQLIVDVTYDRPMGDWYTWSTDSDRCGLRSSTQTLTQYPEPLTFTVPASGRSLTLVQTLGDITDLAVYELPDGAVRLTVRPVAAE